MFWSIFPFTYKGVFTYLFLAHNHLLALHTPKEPPRTPPPLHARVSDVSSVNILQTFPHLHRNKFLTRGMLCLEFSWPTTTRFIFTDFQQKTLSHLASGMKWHIDLASTSSASECFSKRWGVHEVLYQNGRDLPNLLVKQRDSWRPLTSCSNTQQKADTRRTSGTKLQGSANFTKANKLPAGIWNLDYQNPHKHSSRSSSRRYRNDETLKHLWQNEANIFQEILPSERRDDDPWANKTLINYIQRSEFNMKMGHCYVSADVSTISSTQCCKPQEDKTNKNH